MLHRIREARGEDDGEESFDGPVEVDETYMGGKRKNMSNAKRRAPAGTLAKQALCRQALKIEASCPNERAGICAVGPEQSLPQKVSG